MAVTFPLPANLPTNWNSGQTISPNGVEVGLSERHGYNYLMEQVNKVQEAANEIKEASSDAAPKNHAHTGSDGTPQISYNNLTDRPTSFPANGGNAETATRLQTARTIQTNLASTSAASFNGTANVTPGVTGVLPVANGGTGVNNASTAAQMTVANAVSLQTARTILINLAATAAASFNGTANVAPGVSGTLPVARGGTGTTAIGTLSAISATNAQSAFSTANYTNRYLRNIMMSTGAPAAANGSDGDVWIQYT